MKVVTLKNFVNKVLVFYFPGLASYWHTITRCKINSDFKDETSYYLDFSSKYDYPGEFDKDGIPVYQHHSQGKFYHPIVICQYALGLFETLQTSASQTEKIRSDFIKQADWLINNGITFKEKGFIWEINYDITEYGIIKPWYSAMAQGEAMSVLIRAYLISGKQDYAEAAKKALFPFTLEVNDGGLINYFHSHPVYEEYPSPVHTVGVLNGYIFSLFGLFDLSRFIDDKLAGELFSKGVNSLKELLPFYDIGYWSQYYLFDHPGNYPASFTYHMLVVEQLKALSIITKEEIFNKFSAKWLNYSNNYFNRTRALFQKLTYARKLE